MKKIGLQFIGLIGILCILWLGLSQIDWISIFKVEKVAKTTEEKLGNLLWEFFQKTEKEIEDKEIKAKVDSIFNRITEKNRLDSKKYKLHILKTNQVNAFALPGNHIVIFSGLIKACDDETELAGVLGHELAHLEKQHVMKKMLKEFGLSVIVSATGSGGAEVLKEIAKLISSSAFDRNLEREADRQSVEYLIKAEIDPEGFANFLYRLSKESPNLPKELAWINTHPESEERAEWIVNELKNRDYKTKGILSDSSWTILLESL